MRKTPKFAGGGEPEVGTPEYEDLKRRAEAPALESGQNRNIDNATRERAMAAVRARMTAAAEPEATPAPAAVAVKRRAAPVLAVKRRPAPSVEPTASYSNEGRNYPLPKAGAGATTPAPSDVERQAQARKATPYSNEGRNAAGPARFTGMGGNKALQEGAKAAADKLQRGMAGGYAKGGSIDGCAQRGKTRAKTR
jgi:hypothetical protein